LNESGKSYGAGKEISSGVLVALKSGRRQCGRTALSAHLTEGWLSGEGQMAKAAPNSNLGWLLILIPLGIVGYFLEGPIHYIARNVLQYDMRLDSDDWLIIGIFVAYSIWLETVRDKMPAVVRVMCTVAALLIATYLGERYAWPH
jgi:hypothetical protein